MTIRAWTIMKQLKRLKNLLGGGEDSENPEQTEEQLQSESEMKTDDPESKTTEKQETAETQGKTSENPVDPADPAPEKDDEKSVKDEPVKTEGKAAKSKRKSRKAKKQEKANKESEKSVEKTETPKEPEDTEKVEEKPQTKRSDSMTLLNGRDVETITRDSIDENFKQEVIDAGAESLALCFQCGTCTGACPSGRRTPYRVRQVVRKSLMGFKEDVISDDTLWMCSTCYECQERCPRGIKIVDIIKIARNYASQAGYMAKAHKMTGSFVIKTGHGVPINDATMALRKSVGLDELPPTTHQFPEALNEVQAIFKKTGFDNLIGYNWETETIDE